ncbi:MAG: hypothetical protein JWO08_3649 [Verrucomicrobiaceae bacterium]|nr:hypothetical protein [Verrucomicrobiaceae bacterium]
MARNPLAVLAVAAMAGILAVDSHAGLHMRNWSLTLTLIFSAWALWKPATWQLLVAAICGFGFMHACKLEATRLHSLHSVLQPGVKVEVVASGTFIRAPMTPESTGTPTRREARFQADTLSIPSRVRTINGITELRVWLKDGSFVPTGGRYELKGTLYLPSPTANPSIYDPQSGAERQGFVAEFTPREIHLQGPPEFSVALWLLTLAEHSRHWMETVLATGIEGDQAPRILVQTMALGTNEPGSAELQGPFRDSGTLHVFAVSGLHISMLAGIGWLILSSCGMSRKSALIALIVLVISYAFITGWRPSAARAALMTCACLCAPLFDRQARLINALGGCALVLFVANTQQLFQPGFQLSFGVVWAIAAFARLAAQPFERFASLDPFLPMQLASRTQHVGLWARRKLVEVLTVSAVATVASLPIMLLEFHSVTPIGILANCVLVPLSFASLFTVVMSLIAGGLHLTSAQVLFNNANWFWVKAMTCSATWFAAIPGGNFNVPSLTAPGTSPTTLSVLAMPPGEGAQVLQSAGKHWLLDCGGANRANFTIVPFLRHEGVNQLEGVILSHGDADHIGALEALMPRFKPPVVMTSMLEPWRLDSRATFMHKLFAGHVLDATRAGKLQAGDSFTAGETTVHTLYPTPADLYNKGDDRALVLRIDCGKMRVLWCNDAGFITEKHLLARLPASELASQVIVRNQHASDASALPEFLLAVKPRLIITSNTPGDVEQRMPPHLQTHSQEHGITLFDQSETGMVKLQLWRDHAEAKAWLTGKVVTLQP